jgi:cytochrome c peroxidase
MIVELTQKNSCKYHLRLEPIILEDNPLTKGKIDLGKKLFFDKRLSAE